MSNIETIRRGLHKKHKARKLKPEDFLSSGSALLNLAMSDTTYGCWFKGGYFYFVGDSVSGKTFICLTCLAEAARREDFDDYDLIYDGTTENGALMDISRFFGRRVEKRLVQLNSETTDEFYFGIHDRLKTAIANKGKPFIYILDSENGLDSEQEIGAFEERKRAYRAGREMKGSYGGVDKAKSHSQNMRKILKRLLQTGSILIVIGQTRDNLSAIGYADKKTRSGGRALKFYAQAEIWSSIQNHIREQVAGKKRELGIISRVQIKKNRIKGRDRTVTIPIYHSYGIDDIGSCIDYLVDEGLWKGKGKRVVASDFQFSGLRSKLIRKIEKENLERELRAIVRRTWNEIEEKCSLKRKARYE